MTAETTHSKIQDGLTALLADYFSGIKVTVEHSPRWDRMCVTFVWAGFEGLLPEERFQRLTQVIPEDCRAEQLAGFVWLELVPGEEVDAFLELPRSEDVAEGEREIYTEVNQKGFFGKLSGALGDDPTRACNGGFAATEVALRDLGFTSDQICQAKLVFIRHGAYCDCQVVLTVREELADAYKQAG